MNFGDLLKLCRETRVPVKDDSRKVDPGDIFVALPGTNVNGANFIAEAVARGASRIVCSAQAMSDAPASDIELICVDDPGEALWKMARATLGTEDMPMEIVAITGTNGKTTCAWLLDQLYSSLGYRTGLLGTIEYRWPGHRENASLTTPGPLQMHTLLAEMQRAGVQVVIMETSSHSLDQNRTGGIDFRGAIFTNLTQDHLDYHREMENYFHAKAKLFLDFPLPDKAMAINSDDRYGRRLLELVPQALSFGLHRALPREEHLLGTIKQLSPRGMTLEMKLGKKSWRLQTGLIGAFNALNLLAVQGLGLKMGMEPENFKALENFRGVPGRLEKVENSKGLHIFVDYAHTPDALVNALKALRSSGFKRIVTIFGCGGNRDRDKRPLMGKAVAEYSDVAILTSDNPRMEAPEAIMRDVKPGLVKARHALFEVDRRAATARGIQMLGPEDALLIAGKGHEDYQIVGTEKRHYSDQETVRELVSCD